MTERRLSDDSYIQRKFLGALHSLSDFFTFKNKRKLRLCPYIFQSRALLLCNHIKAGFILYTFLI